MNGHTWLQRKDSFSIRHFWFSCRTLCARRHGWDGLAGASRQAELMFSSSRSSSQTNLLWPHAPVAKYDCECLYSCVYKALSTRVAEQGVIRFYVDPSRKIPMNHSGLGRNSLNGWINSDRVAHPYLASAQDCSSIVLSFASRSWTWVHVTAYIFTVHDDVCPRPGGSCFSPNSWRINAFTHTAN